MIMNFLDAENDTVAERIAAMQLVEASPAYRRCGYFGDDDDENSSSLCCSSAADPSAPADIASRAQMIEWMYTIVDYCGFDRERVAVAASFADRFLSQNSVNARRAISDRRQFQLVFMTSLHIAVKIAEPRMMDGPLLSKLSRGKYAAHEFLECEEQLLCGLEWRVSCPTALEFVHELLSLLPKGEFSSVVKADILKDARRMSEIATKDYTLMSTRPSVVALAAILESVEDMSYRAFPSEQRMEFFSAVENVLGGMSIVSEEVAATIFGLQDAFIGTMHQRCPSHLQQGAKSFYVKESETLGGVDDSSNETSPVCVSRMSLSQYQYTR